MPSLLVWLSSAAGIGLMAAVLVWLSRPRRRTRLWPSASPITGRVLLDLIRHHHARRRLPEHIFGDCYAAPQGRQEMECRVAQTVRVLRLAVALGSGRDVVGAVAILAVAIATEELLAGARAYTATRVAESVLGELGIERRGAVWPLLRAFFARTVGTGRVRRAEWIIFVAFRIPRRSR